MFPRQCAERVIGAGLDVFPLPFTDAPGRAGTDTPLDQPCPATDNRLPGKLNLVRGLRAYIFMLHLINFFVSVAMYLPARRPANGFHRAGALRRLLRRQLFAGRIQLCPGLFHALPGFFIPPGLPRRLFTAGAGAAVGSGPTAGSIPAAAVGGGFPVGRGGIITGRRGLVIPAKPLGWPGLFIVLPKLPAAP